ncbi:hypothetical protein LSH36_682g01083 [Paralvinella palmiformis]|uniref:FLYWCH-type domain-containing protein n=1 Tax=Paralvinella palmiformis TaxID=53620 RepID=A0AAD9J328_9ANNE|nr:hypothetical protein LSH36_682g01083 [Paralvinella palmiformis]
MSKDPSKYDEYKSLRNDVKKAVDRDKPTLLDSAGFQYARKVDKRRPDVTWRCHVRGTKAMTCKATVMEKHGDFTRGSLPHAYNPAPGRGASADKGPSHQAGVGFGRRDRGRGTSMERLSWLKNHFPNYKRPCIYPILYVAEAKPTGIRHHDQPRQDGL